MIKMKAVCIMVVSHVYFIGETGRHSNISRENRLCTKCNLRMVENEYHFLLVCPLYIEIRRKQSLNRITAIDCTMQIFKYKYIYM